jgi:hypothetical protein
LLALPVVEPSHSLFEASATGSDRHELVGLRGATSQTWDNGDGTFTTKLFTYPVNYRDPHGRWNRIDSTLDPMPTGAYAFQTRANRFHVRFKSRLESKFLALDLGGSTYSLTLRDAGAAPAAVHGERATYRAAKPGADLSYRIQGDEVEELVTLRRPAAATEFAFELSAPAESQLRFERLRDGSFSFLGKNGTPLFTIPQPTIVGADGVAGPAQKAVSF